MSRGTLLNPAVMNKIERPPSLTTIVVDQIRDLIISGKLALGEQLSEISIADQLGVSRTPVREAFLKLETEGMVEVYPKRGTFVFDYDATELREICELRAVLEAGALRIALEHDRAQLIEALAEQVDRGKAALGKGAAHYQQFDTAFHETLVRLSRNRELVGGYLRISGRICAVRYRLMHTKALITISQHEHGQVVSLLRDGCDADAEATLIRHIYNGYRKFTEQARRSHAGSEII